MATPTAPFFKDANAEYAKIVAALQFCACRTMSGYPTNRELTLRFGFLYLTLC
jgi:hypothetical protein